MRALAVSEGVDLAKLTPPEVVATAMAAVEDTHKFTVGKRAIYEMIHLFALFGEYGFVSYEHLVACYYLLQAHFYLGGHDWLLDDSTGFLTSVEAKSDHEFLSGIPGFVIQVPREHRGKRVLFSRIGIDGGELWKLLKASSWEALDQTVQILRNTEPAVLKVAAVYCFLKFDYELAGLKEEPDDFDVMEMLERWYLTREIEGADRLLGAIHCAQTPCGPW